MTPPRGSAQSAYLVGGEDGQRASSPKSLGVLLLHGLTGMPSEMRPIQRHLSALGFELATPLLPGHGATHRELLDTTWRDWVDGARRALEDLASRSDAVVVAGLSMGALLAVLLAAEDSRVEGIALLSPTMRYDGASIPWTRRLLPLADVVPFLGRITYWTETPPYGLKDERLQRLITRSVVAAKRGETTRFGMFRTYTGALRELNRLAREVRARAGNVRCPAVVLHSVEDTITSVRNAEEIHALLGSREKSIRWLSGCDHVITLDLQKHEVARHVGEFVTRLGSPRGERPSALGRRGDCRDGSDPQPGEPMPTIREGAAPRILLINPKFPESFWSFQWAIDKVFRAKKALSPPLGLATLAALCPEAWHVEIVDENIDPVPAHPAADIVGICGMGVQLERQKELLALYRQRGYFVVAGGSYASLCPEVYGPLADTVVAGEVEYVWKAFCADFESGTPRPLYRETGEVALTDSPVPRFDLLKLEMYELASLQFSRGCPFRCEFCDIIVMFGRKPRTKSLDQVRRELDRLREADVRSVFFVDDNLIGNKPLAKALLQFLHDYQEEHDYWFDFGTEVSLNVAQDAELLRLFRLANFEWVFIGIESPDEESLKETLKFQNTRQDMLSSIRTVYSYGINVLGGFIVGFDHDTAATFEKQHRFIMQSGIHAAMIGLLVAIPKTPLYDRLAGEGRLADDPDIRDNTKLATNIIPKHMGYDEMVDGFRALYRSLLQDRNIADRIKNKTRYFTGVPEHTTDSFGGQFGILVRLLVHGLLPGGIGRMFHFVRSMPLSRPSLIPLAIGDWVVGLTMRDYVDRQFGETLAGSTGQREQPRRSGAGAVSPDVVLGQLPSAQVAAGRVP